MSTLYHRRAAAQRPANDNLPLPPLLPFAAIDHGTFVALARWLLERWRRHSSRQTLATLSDFALRDIGLTRAEAERECAKPFWRE